MVYPHVSGGDDQQAPTLSLVALRLSGPGDPVEGADLEMSWKVALLTAFLAALAGACSGEIEQASTTDHPPTSTSSTETSAKTDQIAGESTTSTTAAPDPVAEVAAAWNDFWSAWVDVRASDDLNTTPLEGVATPAVVTSVLAFLERQAKTSGPVETDVSLSPAVTVETSSTATIEDCVLLDPSVTETTGVWYTAELVNDSSGWKVASLRIQDASGCVPAAMAAEAISAYEAYYAALPEFWNPPDPDHPILGKVLAEPRLSGMRELLAEHAERGVTYRSDPTNHPEVVEVRSLTELVILDCYEPGADDGLYEIASGERLPDEPGVESGQRNLRSAVMVFEDGVWKASDFQGQVNFECVFAPTDRGLPSV